LAERVQRVRIGPLLVSAFVVLGLIWGCGASDVEKTSDRYARRFLPFEKQWRRESGIPPRPQRKPLMVIWEVSDYPPGAVATPEQNTAADELIEACFESAKRHGWFDVREANASGYFKPKQDPNHFRNDEFMLDGRLLDPDRPENLMYYPQADGEMKLVGFMFLADTRTAHGPQIGGPRTVWHFHRWRRMQCLANDMVPTVWAVDGVCESGKGSHRSGEMIHVWLIDHPRGPFATSMILPPKSIDGLVSKRMKERGF
jgi:hypothetical protein